MNIKNELSKYFAMENSDKYVKLNKSTSEEYFSLPLEKRSRKVKYWPTIWYKTPNGMVYNSDCLFTGEDSEWEKYYKQLVKEFPIQARLRELSQYELRSICFEWYILKHRFKDKIYYPIHAIFKPRNPHLAKQIPRQWKAVQLILEDVLIAAFINYCENSGYVTINYTDDPNSDEETNKYFRDQVAANRKVYDYLKLERQVLKNQIEKTWTDLAPVRRRRKSEDYEATYGVINALEKNLLDQDTEALVYIIKNRQNWD